MCTGACRGARSPCCLLPGRVHVAHSSAAPSLTAVWRCCRAPSAACSGGGPQGGLFSTGGEAGAGGGAALCGGGTGGGGDGRRRRCIPGKAAPVALLHACHHLVLAAGLPPGPSHWRWARPGGDARSASPSNLPAVLRAAVQVHKPLRLQALPPASHAAACRVPVGCLCRR